MTYPPISQQEKVNHFLEVTKKLIEGHGITVDIVSIGGSPNMWEVEKIPIGTEYRIGTYIYNDRSLLERKVCRRGLCTHCSCYCCLNTHTSRAVIDAGSKVLTTDLFGLAGHGHIINRTLDYITIIGGACLYSFG